MTMDFMNAKWLFILWILVIDWITKGCYNDKTIRNDPN